MIPRTMPLSGRISNNDEEAAMIYFVTGATGFIGKRLVAKLLEKPAAIVYFLTRDKSPERMEALYSYWNADKSRAIPVVGDLCQPGLGVGKADLKKLKGKVDHYYHLAAIYDLKASAAEQMATNVDGTRNAVVLAQAIDAGCFHHVINYVLHHVFRIVGDLKTFFIEFVEEFFVGHDPAADFFFLFSKSLEKAFLAFFFYQQDAFGRPVSEIFFGGTDTYFRGERGTVLS